MKMKCYFLFVCFLFALHSNAQNSVNKDILKNVAVLDPTEKIPEPGYDLKKYLAENVHYPDSAIAHNIEGRVIVKFVVYENGSISRCEVIKGIGKECNEEALRVVKAMPRWKPGIQHGKPVKVYFTLPVVFKLTD